jgi:hypothetical protein
MKHQFLSVETWLRDSELVQCYGPMGIKQLDGKTLTDALSALRDVPVPHKNTGERFWNAWRQAQAVLNRLEAQVD